ncbi:hypothetical protein BC826DRAFT_383118 [Russula brevipes]|nr:hypothetical protein BC826DRAFT_383118 [Russula brevipes]
MAPQPPRAPSPSKLAFLIMGGTREAYSAIGLRRSFGVLLVERSVDNAQQGVAVQLSSGFASLAYQVSWLARGPHIPTDSDTRTRGLCFVRRTVPRTGDDERGINITRNS